MAIDVGEEMWLSAFQLIEVGRNAGFGGIRIKHAENCLECATAIWMDAQKIERFFWVDFVVLFSVFSLMVLL